MAIATTLDRPSSTRLSDPRPAAPPSGSDTRRRWSVWAPRVAFAAAAVGVAVRVEQFAWRRSLWLDEALVANNIVNRSFSGLLHPLAGQQAAPIGWLWAERAAVIGLGDNEYALRVAPLVCGILAMLLVYRVGRALAGPWAGAAATALLALAPQAVRYSVEVKQYSSDLTVCLLVTVLGIHAAGRRLTTASRPGPGVWTWAAVGALAVWCSYPAVFVLGAGAAVLVLESALRRRWREAAVVIAASGLWLASFGGDWLVSLRHLRGNAYLHDYWRAGFAPEPFRWSTLLLWLYHLPGHLLASPAALPGIAGLGVVAGLAWAMARRPVETGIVAAPVLVGLLGAVTGGFPLEGRMALWLLPVALVGLAGVAAAVSEWVRRGLDRASRMDRAGHLDSATSRRWFAGAVGLCIVAALVQSPARQVKAVADDPATWIDLRPLLQAMRADMRPGDQVWVHTDDQPAAAYYALSTGVATTGVVWDNRPGGGCPGNADLVGAAGGGRVWFIYGYQAALSVPGATLLIAGRLARSASLVARVQRPGVTAWLWDFGSPGRSHGGASPDGLGCLTVVRAPPPVPTGLTTGPLGSGRRV